MKDWRPPKRSTIRRFRSAPATEISAPYCGEWANRTQALLSHRAAVDRAGQAAFRLLRLLGGPFAEAALAFVDPHRALHVGELNSLVGDAFEVEFAGAGALLLVRAAMKRTEPVTPSTSMPQCRSVWWHSSCKSQLVSSGAIAEAGWRKASSLPWKLKVPLGRSESMRRRSFSGSAVIERGANLDAIGPETDEDELPPVVAVEGAVPLGAERDAVLMAGGELVDGDLAVEVSDRSLHFFHEVREELRDEASSRLRFDDDANARDALGRGDV